MFNNLSLRFEKALQEALLRVYSQREEVIEAFIAKYGYEPERFVQVQQTLNDEKGMRFEWSVRRRTDEEMALLGIPIVAWSDITSPGFVVHEQPQPTADGSALIVSPSPQPVSGAVQRLDGQMP